MMNFPPFFSEWKFRWNISKSTDFCWQRSYTDPGLFKEMDLEDFLESHGFLDNDNDMLENPVLGTKTVVIDDEVGIQK